MGMTGRQDIGKVGREACLPRVLNMRNTAARETLPPSERVCPWGHDLAPGASGVSESSALPFTRLGFFQATW